MLSRTRRFYLTREQQDALPRDRSCEGERNPLWNEGDAPRFGIYVHSDPPEGEKQLYFFDYKYLDADAYPVDAIAWGATMAEAWDRALGYMATALANPEKCVFI